MRSKSAIRPATNGGSNENRTSRQAAQRACDPPRDSHFTRDYHAATNLPEV